MDEVNNIVDQWERRWQERAHRIQNQVDTDNMIILSGCRRGAGAIRENADVEFTKNEVPTSMKPDFR